MGDRWTGHTNAGLSQSDGLSEPLTRRSVKGIGQSRGDISLRREDCGIQGQSVPLIHTVSQSPSWDQGARCPQIQG